ncbi:hypothetical protein SAMN05660493_01484 [Epilithonimonas bovis DSM 19482]|uniref:Uncharacterized protein n=1 Tax=Epilithonimonas bovis DSM 19482 TaxID=1121284 RepID=A0A1U7PV76_9FLAO|nr:hypothetical protein SAMN05660493_01484 [Epilithonimonas bovis DSM 19482]
MVFFLILMIFHFGLFTQYCLNTSYALVPITEGISKHLIEDLERISQLSELKY